MARKRDYTDFTDFARERSNLPANEIVREYRRQGGSIGNEKGKALAREATARPFNPNKVTRIRHRSKSEVQEDFDKRFKIKDRFFYLVTFQVEREDMLEPTDEYLHIKSPEPLTMAEIRQATEESWQDGLDAKSERYRPVNIIRRSIKLVYAVDQEL